MSVLNILKYPDKYLKTKAQPVAKIGDETKKLIADMIETMYAARGIGLAATQVGVNKRIAVLDVPDEDRESYRQGKNLIVLINPEITVSEGETKYEEGCLSVPGFTAEVKRFANVTVKGSTLSVSGLHSLIDKDATPLEIKAQGLLAIALQHEIDHLDGLLFIERLSKIKRDIIKRRIKKAIEKEKAEDSSSLP